jgi:hypothetical protein
MNTFRTCDKHDDCLVVWDFIRGGGCPLCAFLDAPDNPVHEEKDKVERFKKALADMTRTAEERWEEICQLKERLHKMSETFTIPE